jgi:hypothetical protein
MQSIMRQISKNMADLMIIGDLQVGWLATYLR